MAAYICTSSDRWRHPHGRKKREEGREMKRQAEERKRVLPVIMKPYLKRVLEALGQNRDLSTQSRPCQVHSR